MTLDFTKPVQTRGGYPVRILCTDAQEPYSVVGIVLVNNYITSWRPDGTCRNSQAHNLVQAPQTRWVNLYRNCEPAVVAGPVHKTEADAKWNLSYRPGYLCTVEIPWKD